MRPERHPIPGHRSCPGGLHSSMIQVSRKGSANYEEESATREGDSIDIPYHGLAREEEGVVSTLCRHRTVGL